ncbi:unnamed protein product, partial [Medioppia subpectinata]
MKSTSVRPSIKSFPKDDSSAPCHLTAFLSYKAGMTHVIRTKEFRAKNKLQTKEVLEAVTILEAPAMIIHGMKYTDLRKNVSYTQEDVDEIKKTSDVIRVLVHSQVCKIKSIRQKKAHISEIQINGGSVSDKVDFALSKLEKEVRIEDVFQRNELIDTIGVTK